MVGKLSFLLECDLSLVVSEFSVSRMPTSISWEVDSVSQMLTSCSSALDVSIGVSHERVSGCLSYFSPLSLSLLWSTLIIYFHIKLQSIKVLLCCYSKPKKFNKF